MVQKGVAGFQERGVTKDPRYRTMPYIHFHKKNILNLSDSINESHVKNRNSALERYSKKLASVAKLQIGNGSGYEMLNKFFAKDPDNFIKFEQRFVEAMADSLNQSVNTEIPTVLQEMSKTGRTVFKKSKNTSSKDTSEDLNNFLNSLKKAVEEIDKVRFSSDDWQDFVTVFTTFLSDKRKTLTAKGVVQLNVVKASQTLKRILPYLSSLRTHWGNVQSITSDFNNIIGSNLSEIAAVGMNGLDSAIVSSTQKDMQQAFKQAVSVGSGTKTSTYLKQVVPFNESDSKHTQTTRVTTDVITKINKQYPINYEIKVTTQQVDDRMVMRAIGEVNSSIKLIQDINVNKLQKSSMVNIGQASILRPIISQLFRKEAYFAIYNTLANPKNTSSTFDNNYHFLSAQIIRHYVDLWISGKGSRIIGANGTDTSTFLVVNGKYYPIISIIKAIDDTINSAKSFDSGSLGVKLYIERNDAIAKNKIMIDGPNRKIVAAYQRSELVRDAINHATLHMSLDLFRYGSVCQPIN